MPFPAVAGGTQHPAENPALLDLGVELNNAVAAHDRALAAKQHARSIYDAMAPTVPADLVLTPEQTRCFDGELEADVEGKLVRPPSGARRRIATVYYLRLSPWSKARSAQSRIGKMARRKLRIAKAYEAACAAAKKASGIEPAMEALYWAEDALRRLSNDIAEAEARSSAGLLIKARAMEAAGSRIEGGIGNLGYQAPLLVAAVLSVLGDAAT